MGFEKCNLSMQGMNNDNKKETANLIIILQQLAAHLYSEALFKIQIGPSKNLLISLQCQELAKCKHCRLWNCM